MELRDDALVLTYPGDGRDVRRAEVIAVGEYAALETLSDIEGLPLGISRSNSAALAAFLKDGPVLVIIPITVTGVWLVCPSSNCESGNGTL
jgi:hypothetical protein